MGTLAVLDLGKDFDWSALLTQHDMLAWLGSRLVAGAAEDDIVFESAILTGTVCNASSAAAIAEAGLVIAQTILKLTILACNK